VASYSRDENLDNANRERVADFLNGAEKDREGTWHWIFEMAISIQKSMVPEFRFIVDIAVETRLEGSFRVKIPPSEATFEIKTAGDQQARAFYEHVFMTLKKWFEGASDLSSNDSPRRIGFRA
jgi:hypothetical protein